MHGKQTRNTPKLPPVCFTCWREWPDKASGLCGICRHEAGLPTVDAYKTPSDAMPLPQERPTVHRIGT